MGAQITLVSLCTINHSSDFWNNKVIAKATASCLVFQHMQQRAIYSIWAFIWARLISMNISVTFLMGGGGGSISICDAPLTALWVFLFHCATIYFLPRCTRVQLSTGLISKSLEEI